LAADSFKRLIVLASEFPHSWLANSTRRKVRILE